jgi:hypothetical protein
MTVQQHHPLADDDKKKLSAPRISTMIAGKIGLGVAACALALQAHAAEPALLDAKFDLTGFTNVLALRAEVEGGTPAAQARYIDLSYDARAMQLVNK